MLIDLKILNDAYEKKFGFIFIVCATGKSASEMLDLLTARIGNSREEEIKNASIEQRKITKIRIEKMLLGVSQSMIFELDINLKTNRSKL